MQPKIIGHRGAKNEYPENTLGSIRFALEKGVAGIEVDVHLTADGRLAVMHDAEVSRTTDGAGFIRDMTAEELGRLDAGRGEQIPFLEDVLELTKDVTLFVEIKCPDIEQAVIDAIRATDRVGSCIIKAFNHRIAQKVKELCPDLRAACLFEGLPVHAYRLAADAGAEFVSLCATNIDRAAVEECHAHDVGVCVWTAETSAARDRFVEMGVDYVITGTPGVVCGG